MKRWRWKRILLISAGVLLVLTTAALWTLNFAVNKVLDTIASDSIIASMDVSPAPSAAITAPPPPLPSPSSETTGTTPQENANQHTEQPQPTKPVQPSTVPASTPTSSEPSPNKTIAPTSTPYEGTIDADKATKAQEEITLEEKLKVTSIFMKKFSAKELDAFMKLASGGLSIDEKKEAKKIVLGKLTEEEYDQLIQIAAKLGLSQGKNYNDSLKELQADNSGS